MPVNLSADTSRFLFEYLGRVRPIPGASDSESLQCDYLQDGLVDSLGLITMVIAIEERFGIVFTTDEFEDPRFKTVGGLIEIVDQKVATSR